MNVADENVESTFYVSSRGWDFDRHDERCLPLDRTNTGLATVHPCCCSQPDLAILLKCSAAADDRFKELAVHFSLALGRDGAVVVKAPTLPRHTRSEKRTHAHAFRHCFQPNLLFSLRVLLP